MSAAFQRRLGGLAPKGDEVEDFGRSVDGMIKHHLDLHRGDAEIVLPDCQHLSIGAIDLKARVPAVDAFPQPARRKALFPHPTLESSFDDGEVRRVDRHFVPHMPAQHNSRGAILSPYYRPPAVAGTTRSGGGSFRGVGRSLPAQPRRHGFADPFALLLASPRTS